MDPQTSNSEFSPALNPQERNYHLKCKVQVIRKQVHQGIKDEGSEATMALLIPEANDQGVRFLNAWLPEDNAHRMEVIVQMGHPVYGSARCSVWRANENCKVPHLFVMTKAVEDVLIHKDGESLEVKTERGTIDVDGHDSDLMESDISVERL